MGGRYHDRAGTMSKCKLIGWDIDDLDTDSHEASSLGTYPHAMVKVWHTATYLPHYETKRYSTYQCEHCKEPLSIDNNGIIQGG